MTGFIKSISISFDTSFNYGLFTARYSLTPSSGENLKAGRYTFILDNPYNAKSPLVPSGLLGPVRVMVED